MGKKLKRGKAGNAAQYITRTQAIRKLQLRLSEFRRLCIFKGIHPREPKKKHKGLNKTYYHVKDINWLAHEPLINTFRKITVYKRRMQKAKAKKNRALLERLKNMRPGYRLDHLVRERYPSFVDALRDLDDPLTLVHLFATLPSELKYGIPVAILQKARQLALEWQAYIVRASALRRVFVSVKGYFFQAEVLGQSVTWLVPHQLSQVLPTDVDYRVMTTFLQFYSTLLQFVNFKLYHMLGLSYPPRVDPQLEEVAAELFSIMKDLGGAQEESLKEGAAALEAGGAEDAQVVQARIESLQARLREMVDVGAPAAGKTGEAAGSDDDEENADLSASCFGAIDSGDESEEESEEDSEAGAEDEEEADAEEGKEDSASEDDDEAEGQGEEDGEQLSAEAKRRAAGGALAVDPSDESAVCGSLFRGFRFFLSREVPREPLLLLIRAFGGVAGWQGEGSPYPESDERITHQVVDRPTQGHRFLSRDYVQPQWVFDGANFRVLMPADLYAPGHELPPHLSPFAGGPGAEDDGYEPAFLKTIKKLQEAARSARMEAAGILLADVGGEDASEFAAEGAGPAAAGQRSEEELARERLVQEKQYTAELAKEVRESRKRPLEQQESEEGESDEGKEEVEEEEAEKESESEEEVQVEEKPVAVAAPAVKGKAAAVAVAAPVVKKQNAAPAAAAAEPKKAAPAPSSAKKEKVMRAKASAPAVAAVDEVKMSAIMMDRKKKKMYEGLLRKEDAKRQRIERLKSKST